MVNSLPMLFKLGCYAQSVYGKQFQHHFFSPCMYTCLTFFFDFLCFIWGATTLLLPCDRQVVGSSCVNNLFTRQGQDSLPNPRKAKKLVGLFLVYKNGVMNSGSNFQREPAPTIVVNQTNRPQNLEDHHSSDVKLEFP